MVHIETIEHLKESVKITDYLYSRGMLPVNSTGKQFVYRSPLTNEKSASFFVEPNKNVFNDFSSGEKGDNIRLVQIIEKVDFVSAIRLLEKQQPYSVIPFDTDIVEKMKQPKNETFEIINIMALQHRMLQLYLLKRAIPYNIAFPYVKEIHYTTKGRNYFGIGFQTDKGSWAVRSDGFKTWIGSSCITTLEIENSNSINLFEGFFDFLSALTYFRVNKMRNTTIILNSNSNLAQAMERLKAASTVYTFLDTDGNGTNGGLQTLRKVRNAGCNVIDRSGLYEGYKDFNDRLRAL